MDRREFLQCASVLVSGLGASQVGLALSEEQRRYLADAPDYVTAAASYFNPAQRRVVAAIADVIIPQTETPGAIDAGVPRYIELMVQDWLNDQERALFDGGLAALQARVQENHAATFEQLSAPQQLALLEQLEAEASDSDWYEIGNVQRTYISDAPFICQIKELTVYGFFTSKVGSTQVLRYDPMPMEFDGDTPLQPGDTSWAYGLV